MTDVYHETLARRTGFKPYSELTPAEADSVEAYCYQWYSEEPLGDILYWHWWKESTIGDNNWISYDVGQHNRINAPHLRSK